MRDKRIFIGMRALLVVATMTLYFPILARDAAGCTAVQIEGAYRLVEETTIYVRPRALSVRRAPPYWSGLFFFADGHFSVSLMDNKRSSDWFTAFPTNIDEIGYETFAGGYDFDGATLTLRPELKLHPFYDRLTKSYEAKLEGNILKLTRTIRPYVEDMREGEQMIVLSRLNASKFDSH